jgi:hypothetical protein
MRTPGEQKSKPDRNAIGARRPRPPISRTVFSEQSVSLWGWPSRGGLIVLRNVTGADFDFLGLDPVHPPLQRSPDQDEEDEFCQQLLLLGAKWFDSKSRYVFVFGVAQDEEPCILALENGEAPEPTTMERRWVSVGWPSEPDQRGGLWVADFDTTMYGVQEKHNLVPSAAVKVTLARTMDEKCAILKSIGGKFHQSLDMYDGAACLKAWTTKTAGEVGPLEPTKYETEGA